MKNKSFFIALACMATLPAMAQKPCRIKGEITNNAQIEKIYFYQMDAQGKLPDDPTDSCELKKNEFQHDFNVTVPQQAYILAKQKDGSRVGSQIILVPGEKANFTLDGEHFTCSGSKFYKEWGDAENNAMTQTNKLRVFIEGVNAKLKEMSEEERSKQLPALQAEYEKMMGERTKSYDDYYNAHKAEAGCVFFYMTNISNITKYYDTMDPAVKNGPFAKYLADENAKFKAQLEAREKAAAEAKAAEENTGEGHMFTDFEAEYNGKVQKLSDYVGKGKYVLVDFWASWCGPCKAEIPNLIEVYNKYKGENFEVLGVATWDKPRDTEKAIEQMKIPYPQIMNAQNAGSDAYGIEGIPQIILFAPDGKIVKRNLRGAAIEATIKELLNK